MAYASRIVDDELADRLASAGAVVIDGPKACGKTETARRQAASEVLLDIDTGAQQAATVDPGLVLPGDHPRLLDEWQIRPDLWNHVRRAVDQAQAPGLFILTGSSVPADDDTRHTGAGRFGRLRMRPMTLSELDVGSRDISLAHLLAGAPTTSADTGLTVPDLVELVARGGWPGYRHLGTRESMRAIRDYVDQTRRTDITRVDGVRRDPERVMRVLRSLARHTSTQAKLTTIARDASGTDANIKDDTVAGYIEALTRLMIVEDLPAWQTHIRSSHALRRAPTRHFVDPSIAVAALGANQASLLADLNAFGMLFESMVIRDLRVYAQANDAQVWHYRDSSDLEVDAIITSDTGSWIALEVKLAPATEMLDEAARNLHRLATRVDTSKTGEPAALGIVVGTGYGYVRPDGIHVIPIGALAP